MMKIFATIVILLTVIAGCAGQNTKISDLFHYRFYLIDPPTGNLNYEDKDLQFSFTLERDYITIALVNKSNSNVTIDWEKAVYEDPDRRSHRLVKKGANYEDKGEDKGNPQTPVLLPRGYKLVESLIPVDNIDHKFLIGLKVRPMFPELKSARTVEEWDGATFEVILPVEINGEPRRYRFAFRVKTKTR